MIKKFIFELKYNNKFYLYYKVILQDRYKNKTGRARLLLTVIFSQKFNPSKFSLYIASYVFF